MNAYYPEYLPVHSAMTAVKDKLNEARVELGWQRPGAAQEFILQAIADLGKIAVLLDTMPKPYE